MPLDVTIKRADLWVGSIALEVEAMSAMYVFGEIAANASRQIRVSMPVSPWSPNGAAGIDWDGSSLQWRLLDFGGGYRVRNNLSVLVGLRVDHFSVAFGNPQDPTGTLHLTYGPNTGTLVGDIRTKMWAPYVGLALSGDAYKARIVYSPVTSADVRMPLQFKFPSFDQEASYTQFKTGWYTGFDAAYRTFAGQGFAFDVWASGSYSIIRGYGQEEFTEPAGTLFGEGTSTFVTSSLAVGLSANLDF